MPESPGSLSDQGKALTARLLSETREELAKADGKAQILLAASGVVIGVVLGGAISGNWSPGDLEPHAEVIWWIGVASAALGIGALGFSIFPRLLQSDGSRITYFEDIRQVKDLGGLMASLNKEAERGDRDAQQLFRLSPVVHRKYWAIQWAIRAFGVAAVLCGIAALVG
jgi:MFS family permease